MSEWSPAVEQLANAVSVDMAQALHEGVADPTVRDFAADMARIGYGLGVSYGRLEAAHEHVQRCAARIAAELDAAVDDYPEAAKCPSVTLAPAEAVLSETSEPYVSVSVSANANDADELAKLLRKIIREKGAKSFGLAEG